MAPTFIISAALKGGYTVRQDSGRDFIVAAVHFAGTLDECLGFVRDELMRAANAPAETKTFSDELLLRAAVSAERMKRLRGVLDEIASGAKSPEAAVVQAVIEIEASLARRAEQAS